MTHEEIKYDDRGEFAEITEYDGEALLYSYVKLLNKYDAINVLSMPRLLCTDNKESTLQVGQVIPQLKGAVSDASNPSAVQNSYEYKETGIILKVTPHVRSGTLVALDIDQTLEEVLTTTANTTHHRQAPGEDHGAGAGWPDHHPRGAHKRSGKVHEKSCPGALLHPPRGQPLHHHREAEGKDRPHDLLTPYILESPQEA